VLNHINNDKNNTGRTGIVAYRAERIFCAVTPVVANTNPAATVGVSIAAHHCKT